MLAGLGKAGARQLHFFIAEEGLTAAAYVVVTIVGDTWTIEECGDRDPSGARVGAILQALIAREPVERRPTIRACLPRGFVPPQVTIVSTKLSTNVLMVRSVGSTAMQPRLSGDDVLYWRGDIFWMNNPPAVVAAPPLRRLSQSSSPVSAVRSCGCQRRSCW